MKTLRFLLRLSLLANIVLILYALSQRAQIQELLADEEEEVKALESATEGLQESRQHLKDSILRTIASTDQLDAFIEEHSGYGEE
jgi:hypothetical protein